MYWIIVLVIVLFIVVIVYRKYYHPSLSSAAKQQREKYLGNFQKSQTLIYHMQSEKVEKLCGALAKHYQSTYQGCYYGNGVMINLEQDDLQVSVQVFSRRDEDLARNIWKVTRLKKRLGGVATGASNG